MTFLTRHRHMRAVHPHQLTLPLLWTHEQVRASLVVIRGGVSNEPEPLRAERRRAA